MHPGFENAGSRAGLVQDRHGKLGNLRDRAPTTGARRPFTSAKLLLRVNQVRIGRRTGRAEEPAGHQLRISEDHVLMFRTWKLTRKSYSVPTLLPAWPDGSMRYGDAAGVVQGVAAADRAGRNGPECKS